MLINLRIVTIQELTDQEYLVFGDNDLKFYFFEETITSKFCACTYRRKHWLVKRRSSNHWVLY
jgi:hypothetical protein